MSNKRIPNILLVDDSPADQITVRRAFEDGLVECNIVAVDNGKQALELLRGQLIYEDRIKFPFPDLILMDINMPVMDGKDALRAIRADPELKNLPVIMLTTSNSSADVKESYGIGANAYIAKPVVREQFLRTIKMLESFWLDVAILPQVESSND